MKKPENILFLCTGNCCRSQMAEAILRHVGGDAFKAYSAGSHPAGFVHPLVEPTLAELGVPPIEDAESQGIDDFLEIPIDLVITVCDDAAQYCPAWLGNGMVVHWPVTDPSIYQGSSKERLRFSFSVGRRLYHKIEQLVQMDYESMSESEVKEKLDLIGEY